MYSDWFSMRMKFPGRCCECATGIGAGEMTWANNKSGKWKFRCDSCHGRSKPTAPGTTSESYIRGLESGEMFFDELSKMREDREPKPKRKEISKSSHETLPPPAPPFREKSGLDLLRDNAKWRLIA